MLVSCRGRVDWPPLQPCTVINAAIAYQESIKTQWRYRTAYRNLDSNHNGPNGKLGFKLFLSLDAAGSVRRLNPKEWFEACTNLPK